MLVHREPKLLSWPWTSSWLGYHYHHHHQQQQQLNHHTNLQGPQKYRRQQPSDRHGPSQEGLQALADVMIEDYDQDYDEDEVYDPPFFYFGMYMVDQNMMMMNV